MIYQEKEKQQEPEQEEEELEERVSVHDTSTVNNKTNEQDILMIEKHEEIKQNAVETKKIINVIKYKKIQLHLIHQLL